jgi:uncharacterized protein YeeX (DUF496 family)
MEKKVLIEEINRMRTIMGLNLLTEGNIFGEAANIWKTLLTKEASALTAEEKEILQKMINRVSEFSQAGIKNVDELLSTQGKEVLRQVLRTTKDEISDALKRSLDEVTTIRIKNIMAGVDNSFKTAMGGVAIPGSGTISDIISKIELKGVNSVPETILDTTIVQLNGLKGSLSDVQQKYVDDITNEINNHLDTKSRNFANEAVAAGVETTAEKTLRDSEERIQKLLQQNSYIDLVLNELSVYDSWKKLKPDQKSFVEDFVRTEKGLGKTNIEVGLAAKQKVLNYLEDALMTARNKGDNDLVAKITKSRKLWDAITPNTSVGWVVLIVGIIAITGGTILGTLGYLSNIFGTKEQYKRAADGDSSEETSSEENSSEEGGTIPDEFWQ